LIDATISAKQNILALSRLTDIPKKDYESNKKTFENIKKQFEKGAIKAFRKASSRTWRQESGMKRVIDDLNAKGIDTSTLRAEEASILKEHGKLKGYLNDAASNIATMGGLFNAIDSEIKIVGDPTFKAVLPIKGNGDKQANTTLNEIAQYYSLKTNPRLREKLETAAGREEEVIELISGIRLEAEKLLKELEEKEKEEAEEKK